MQASERDKVVATKLFELANIEAGVLIFGEVAGRDIVRWEILATGAAAFVVLYIFAAALLWHAPHHKI